jgi:NADPH:quinone reductase-like Zn-dependent oxidoreductase
MKAFVLPDKDSQATMQEVPTPEAGPGEVLIRVRASSVNGWDVFVASGMARDSMEHRYPVILGKDFAGVITGVGVGVTARAVGDEVIGIMPPDPYLARGSYSEFVAVPAEGFIERKPPNLDFEQAASVGLAALTALVSVDAIDPSERAVVLISGATGGVGAYAVQLAAARGATVIATALPDDEAWIRGLGASEVVDYSADVAAAVRKVRPEGVDSMIAAVPLGEHFDSVAGLVKDRGQIATTVGGADADALGQRGIEVTDVFGQSDPGPFARVVAMAADGSLTVPIRQTFGFDELPEALGLVGTRRSRGKFAVTIGD